MRVGGLRRRVEIQRHTIITDEYGGRIEGWTTEFHVWAAVASVTGREFFSGAATQSGSTWKMTMRYIPGMESVKHRLYYDGAFFDVTAVLPDERERFMTLVCSRIADVSHEEIVMFTDEYGIHRILHTIAPESTLKPEDVVLA